MSAILSSEDETYKFILKKLKAKFHKRICGDGEKIELLNVELIPPDTDHKYMDGHYRVDDNYQQNVEFQSTPVYSKKMIAMYKYVIYSQCDDCSRFYTCIVATYPPNQGIMELKIGDMLFQPRFFFTKNLKATEIIKIVKNKNENNIPLMDNECVDLLMAPDMNHEYDIKELLDITTKLLVEATVLDKEFHNNLIDCQKKVLKRFLTTDERKEIENMINFKAEDFGLKPNVTGFEEEINLAYLDGKRDGFDDGFDKAKLSDVKNLIDLGFDDESIKKITELDLKTIQSLRMD